MKTNLMMAGALILSFAAAGCATKKYVAKTVSPIESRVTATEQKNTEQDKQLADHAKDLDSLSTDLSRTKERVTDADAKAVAAGQAAQRAGERADNAQRSADGAQQAADSTRAFADRGLQRSEKRSDVIEKNMEAMNKFDMAKSVTVLFGLNQSNLDKDAKAALDELAQMTNGKDRYIIEVQGFTDKTGSALANEQLSQARAAAVSRYLVNEHKIPVRTVNALGSGYALPVADDKTREGRKQNRRVEVRLFVPEATQSSNTVAAAQE